jgi:alpha-tubulin suppressor-like RCC1 family protein
VRCWGENHAHQLGDGGTNPRAEAAEVKGLGHVTAIAAGDFLTCAVSDDGLVRCWGRARLESSLSEVAWSVPTVLPGVSDVAELAIEEHHGCLRRRNGELRCWDSYRRPKAAEGAAASPIFVEPRGHGATQLRVFDQATCVRAGSDGFRCWGANAWGELSPAADSASDEGKVYSLDIQDAVEVTGGSGFLCARTRTGAVVCQGSSRSGEAGDGTADRDTPTLVRW